MTMIAFETINRTGDAHAVPDMTSDRSLCGIQMLTFGGKPRPLLESQWDTQAPRCRECSSLVYGAA